MTAALGIILAQNQGQRCRLLEPEDIGLNTDNVTIFFTAIWFTPINALLMTLTRIYT